MRNAQHVINDMVNLGDPGSVAPVGFLGYAVSLVSDFINCCIFPDEPEDPMKYPRPPEIPLNEVLAVVKKKFPDLGRYESVSSRLGKAKPVTRDASMDLSVLIAGAMRIKWYFEKTSKRNGRRQLKNEFKRELGKTAAELLCLLVERSTGP